MLRLSILHYPLEPTRPSAHVIALSPCPSWTHWRGLTYRGTSALFINYNRPTIFIPASWKSREPPSARKGRLYHWRRVLMESHSTVCRGSGISGHMVELGVIVEQNLSGKSRHLVHFIQLLSFKFSELNGCIKATSEYLLFSRYFSTPIKL